MLSLLQAIGDVSEEHNGKMKVRVGTDTLVLSPPRRKDVDEDLVVQIRHLLRDAGYLPEKN